ncbi:MAG: LCP family protein [Eubacteriales bacterium]
MAGLRNFLITFVLSLVIFSVAGYMLVGFVNSNIADLMNPTDTSSEEETTDPTGPTDEGGTTLDPSSEDVKGTSFTGVLIGRDKADEANKKASEVDTILLIRVNKEKKCFVLTSVPANMRVYVGGYYVKLSQVYDDYGVEFFVDKIAALTGMKVNYYADIDMEGFIKVFDILGGVTYDVQQDMQYTPPGASKPEIDIRKGRRTLTSAQALDVLRYKSYSNGDVGRTALQRDFLKAVFRQKVSIDNLTKAPEVFSLLVKYMKTNMELSDFTANIDLIFSYSKYEQVDIAYPGTVKTIDDVGYILSRILTR